MSFVKASMLHDTLESVKYDDQIVSKMNQKGNSGIGYAEPENSKPSWLKNRLDKDRARAGSQSSDLHKQRHSSVKGHCDVLSMQMDSDLVIYRTTLVRTFQVVTICRVDKSEVLVVLISPHYSKNCGRPLLSQNLTAAASTAAPPCRRRCDRTCSNRRVEEIPFVPNSSGLLVQADEGVVFSVVDLIKEDLPPPTLKSQIPCEFGWSQEPRRQQGDTL
ncbi:hypothetical protein F511_05115 [Dorcoceras hygrometricum]|uniref:Uncharacterized protein n=1 Tax=Dorcoceras hygrometricum TaxID=472368 RepID=A0A2Z7AP20_9LAMI|nr:hypothetical protein F511_05115 [Dorcoceras hygrometricum]